MPTRLSLRTVQISLPVSTSTSKTLPNRHWKRSCASVVRSRAVQYLMEVQTGLIKAIANLTLQADGSYSETYNYALGAATEPGSTFKLASVICLLEDGHISLSDTVDIEGGIKKFHDRTMRDSKTGLYNRITIAKAFRKIEQRGHFQISESISMEKTPKFSWIALRKMKLNQALKHGYSGRRQADDQIS
jgi:cell division protein FtsI/penicillin-binding protein 2